MRALEWEQIDSINRKMKANIFMAAYFIIMPVILVAQNPKGTSTIAMLFKLDPSSTYKTNFQFSSETFQQFYSCLRYSSWRTCTGSVSNNPPPQFLPSDKYVTSVGHDNQLITFADPDYFECSFALSASQIQCQRYGSPCNRTDYFFFSLCNSTSCDLGCVRLLSNRGEEIQGNTDVIKQCNVSCKQSTTSVTELVTTVPSQSSSVPSSKPTVTTAESSTYASGKQTKEEANESNIPIIAGVASGCAAIIIIGIIICILLWRKRHRSNSKAKNTPDVTFSGASVANSGNHEQNVHNSDFQANSSHLPEKRCATVPSYENEIRPSNNNDNDYGYNDIDPPCTKNGYLNVLHHTQQGDITNKHKHDPDYELAENIDPYNEATTSPEVDHYSENTETTHPYNEGSSHVVHDDYSETHVLPSTHDDYSTPTNDNNLQIIDMASNPKNIYAKLGEDFRDIKNPYNVAPQKKHNQKPKNAPPGSRKPDVTSYETVDNSVKIVNISTPASQTKSSHESHNGSNQSDKIDKENTSKNNVTTDFPEYAVVKKHKEDTSKPKVTIDFPEYAVVIKQKK